MITAALENDDSTRLDCPSTLAPGSGSDYGLWLCALARALGFGSWAVGSLVVTPVHAWSFAIPNSLLQVLNHHRVESVYVPMISSRVV